MIVRVFLMFNAGPQRYRPIRAMLERLGCEEGLVGEGVITCGNYGHMFEATDPALAALKSELRQLHIRWLERIEHSHTDAELRQFPLLHLRATREVPIVGVRYGTQYDLLVACPDCGTGAEQTSPLILPKAGFHRTSPFYCTSTETLVGEKLAKSLREAGLSGLRLGPVLLYRKNVPVPWWQLQSTYEMPRVSGKTKGLVFGSPMPCQRCGRSNHYETMDHPLALVYDRSEVDVTGLPDVVKTWECMGHSRIDRDLKYSRFATPIFLVKPRVFEIFRALKIRQAHFDPVRIE